MFLKSVEVMVFHVLSHNWSGFCGSKNASGTAAASFREACATKDTANGAAQRETPKWYNAILFGITILNCIRFKLLQNYQNLAKHNIVTVESNQHWFKFKYNEMNHVAANAYLIRIAVKVTGSWSDYGARCILNSAVLSKDAMANQSSAWNRFQSKYMTWPEN